MTVRIVTDSACDLRGDEVDELSIEVVPLSIRFGDDEYVDREQLTVDQFYALLADSEKLPETAAPGAGVTMSGTSKNRTMGPACARKGKNVR